MKTKTDTQIAVQSHQLLASVLAGALMLQAQPALALDADCVKQQAAVMQTLQWRKPADPEVAQAVLQLQQEGLTLCRNGHAEQGSAKLKAAMTKLDTVQPITDPTQP